MRASYFCGLAFLVVFSFAANLSVAGEPAEELVHRSDSGVEFTVTADGLSKIRVGERTVAEGRWCGWNAGPHWFGLGDEDGVLAYGGYSHRVYDRVAGGIEEKSIEVLGPDHARVRHVQPDAVATYDYRFDGEDVTIGARLENNHRSEKIEMPAFGGLRLSFDGEPRGQMRVWHTSYLRHVRTGAFHPSHLNKIGGSYATDGELGVGVTPVFDELERTLIFWDYDRWNPTTVDRRANRWLSYLRPDPVPPGGALTFRLQLRVSPDTDWKHLLAPYKRQFLAAFGEKKYETDFRCVAVAHVNRNVESIGPNNPYGFHGGFRRLDRPDAVKKLCDMLVPALKVANGQGIIFWGQGGHSPRGAMYRTDFDVLPPEVQENWSILRRRFGEAGLRIGVTTRPGQLTVRKNWEKDRVLALSPDEPSQLRMLWQRFDNMIEMGCRMFYLDSFGAAYDHVRIMRHLREKMGPQVMTFAEHACDVMAVYSAFYSETDFWAEGSAKWAKEDRWRPRTGLEFQRIVDWLVGPVPVITRAYDIHGEMPEGFVSSTEFFYRHGMSPMIEDYTLPKGARKIRRIQDRYVDEEGNLKEAR